MIAWLLCGLGWSAAVYCAWRWYLAHGQADRMATMLARRAREERVRRLMNDVARWN